MQIKFIQLSTNKKKNKWAKMTPEIYADRNGALVDSWKVLWLSLGVRIQSREWLHLHLW